MLTYEKAHELFEIRDDGELIRKVSTGPNSKKGAIAGWVGVKGYRKIRLNGKNYLVHRIVWLMVHGKFAIDGIDHINGNKLDNRISNLREATNGQNLQNLIKAMSNNKLGLLGVRLHKHGRFQARITLNGKVKYLGYFDTPEDAHDAYLKEKRKIHEFCTI